MKNTDKELEAEGRYDMAREAGLISPTPPDRKKRDIKINWSRDKSKAKARLKVSPFGVALMNIKKYRARPAIMLGGFFLYGLFYVVNFLDMRLHFKRVNIL